MRVCGKASQVMGLKVDPALDPGLVAILSKTIQVAPITLDRVGRKAALEMQDFVGTRNGFEFRIGISSGPLVGGVVGTSKFQYDIWGDTVNVASRMESGGEPGCVQISENTYELVKDHFECEPRGEIEVKGKGSMKTWFVLGRRD